MTASIEGLIARLLTEEQHNVPSCSRGAGSVLFLGQPGTPYPILHMTAYSSYVGRGAFDLFNNMFHSDGASSIPKLDPVLALLAKCTNLEGINGVVYVNM